MSAKDIADIYRSRFQVEFLFREGKQFMGICDCHSRNTQAMDFAFNLSLSVVNAAKALVKHYVLNLSSANCKLLFHNAMMIERFLLTFGRLPNVNKNQGQKEHYFKELLLYRLKAT